MVNAVEIPRSSDDEWAVVVFPRSFWSKFTGRIELPLDYAADRRLVASTSHSVTGTSTTTGRGLVPRREYDAKITEFCRIIGEQRRQMALVQWTGFLFVVFAVPPAVTVVLGEEHTSMILFSATVIPLVTLAYDMSWQIRAQRDTVQHIFAPWQTRYGIEDIDWWVGSKRLSPRLAFRLPEVRDTHAPVKTRDDARARSRK